MTIPATASGYWIWLVLAAQELSNGWRTKGSQIADPLSPEISLFFKISDAITREASREIWSEESTDYADYKKKNLCNLWLRGGGFGVFVMLGGVKTKDVLSLA